MASFEEIRAKMNDKYGDSDGDRKKQNDIAATTSSDFESIRSEMNSKYGDPIVDESYIKSFVSDAKQYLNSAQLDYDKIGTTTDASVYQTSKKTADDLRKRSSVVRRYLDRNKTSVNSKDYESLISYLEDFDRTSSQIIYALYRAENNYSKRNAESEGLLNFDLDAGQKEIDELEAQADALDWTNHSDRARMTELTNLINQKKAYLNRAKYLQEATQLGSVNDPDAENYDPEFSKYTEYAGSTWIDGGLKRFFSWDENARAKTGYEDIRYDFINDPDAVAKVLSKSTSNSDLQLLSGLQVYRNMTEEQISIYNYHYAKNGKEAADKYLDSIQESLNEQEALDIYEPIKGKTLLELAFGVAAGLEQFGSGVRNLFNTKDDYIPQSVTQIASGMVREDLSDIDLKWYNFKEREWSDAKIFGNSLGQVGYDAVTTTANMAPSILASVAIAAVNPMAGAVAGNVLMGAAADGNAYQEKLNLGYSQEQARAYGLMVGTSEAVLGQLLGGISKLGGGMLSKTVLKNLDKADNILAKFAKSFGGRILMSAGSEAFEEGLQNVIEPYLWQAVSGEEATVEWEEAFYSALLGFATGGLFEGGDMAANAVVKKAQANQQTTGMRNAAANEFYANKYREDIPGLVQSVLAIDPENQMAKAVREKLDNQEAVTDQEILQLAEPLVAAKMEKTASARLNELGETGDVAALSKAAVKSATGQTLTAQEKAALKGSDYGSQVATELSKSLKEEEKQAKKWGKETAKDRMKQLKGFEKALIKHNKAVQKGETDPDTELQDDIVLDEAPEETFEVADDGATVQRSTGKTIKIKDVAFKNGKLTLQTEDGSEVAASDVSYGTEAEAMVYEAVAQLDGIIDGKTATKLSRNLIRQINEGDAISDHYIQAVTEAYRFGYEGRGIEAVRAKTSIASELTDRQRNYAYNMGQKYGTEGKPTRQDNGTKTPNNGTKTADNGTDITKGRKKTAKRSKAPDGKSYDNVQFESKVKTWGEKQRADVEFLNFVARDIAGGVTVHVFESFKGPDGNRYYYDRNGNLQNAPNGRYIHANGDIYLDLNAGDSGEGLVLNTFAHELYHHIETWSPAKARQLAQFLVKEQGLDSVGAMVEAQIEKAEAAGHGVKYFMKQGMSRTAAENTVKARAFSDFVADSLEAVFTKGDALGTLQRLKKSDQGLFDKIKAFVDKWVSKLKKYYQGDHTISIEGQTTAQLETFQQIQDLFMEALVDAGENFRKGEVSETADTDTDVDTERSTADGIVYSARDYAKQVDEVKNNTHDPKNHVYMGSTPGAIAKILELPKLPMLITSQHIYSMAVSEKQAKADGRFKSRMNYHNLGWDTLKKLPEYINAPVMVIKSNTDTNDATFVVITSQMDAQGNPLVVAIKPNGRGKYFNLEIPTNITLSGYGKEGIQRYVAKAKTENRILYASKKNSQKNKANPSVQFADVLLSSDYTNNLANFKGIVKQQFAGTVFENSGLPQFSDRNVTPTSNRSLLANALENAVQNDEERQKLQAYRAKINQIEADELKLSDLKKQLYEMTFAKGPRDAEYREKMASIQKEVASTERRLNKSEKEVLNLEATKPLQDLLKREKDAVKRRMEKKHQQVLRNQKEEAAKEQAALKAEYVSQREKQIESRKRTEMKLKIRNAIRALYKLYSKGKDVNNVKEEMKDVVISALASAEMLFDNLYSDDDIIRNGVGLTLTTDASKLLSRAKDILYKLDNPPASLSVEQLSSWERYEKKLRNELNDIKKQLKQVFLEERQRRDNGAVGAVMQSLCDAYKSLAKAENGYIKNAYDPAVEEYLLAVRARLMVTRVEDMTLAQLEQMYDAYTMVLHTIRNANKMFCANRSVDGMAKQLIIELGGKERKLSKSKIKNVARNISDYIGWSYEKLYYALEKVGSETLAKLFVNLANAEDTIMKNIVDAKAYQMKLVDDYGYNQWKINQKLDREFLDKFGRSFQLTLGEIMMLYAYTRRGNVWKQLEVGGFVFGKQALTEVKDVTTHMLTRSQCISITNTLTAEQKHFVEDMVKYLSEVMGAKGNEVSMLLYGIKLFKDPNYFPVHIAGQYKARAAQHTERKEAGFVSLSNAGFTKEKNEKSAAPVVIESFMDIWVDHVNEMSRYHGAVPALEDIRRVMNYSDYSDAEAASVSVRAMIENRHGEQCANYFDDLCKEVNSGAVTDKLQSLPKKALSISRKLAVAYSTSVLIQQPSSISRAFAMVDPKYFAGLSGAGASAWGVAKTVTNRWSKKQTVAYAEMVKYAPGVTLAKEIGGFDASGGGIRNYLMDTDKSLVMSMKTGTAGEKLQAVGNLVDDNPVANLPNLADKIAWIEIWNACKRETKDKHRSMDVKSEAYMKLVGKRFTEAIRATQVYDSVFAKSPWLKSKNVAVQYMVSFMNEPNVVANMVESTIRDIRDGDFKKAAKKLGAVTRSIIFCNVLKSLIYAMRDDDEDETYIEKYMQALIGNVISDFTGFNYIPLVRDIWSVCRGYDVERPDMSIFSDLILSIQKYYKVKNKDASEMSPEELEKWNSQCTEVEWGLIGAIAGCFGIPIKNIYREIDSVFNCVRIRGENVGKTSRKTFWDACYQGVVDALPWHDQESKSDKLYEALTEGNTKYLERLQAGYLNSDGKLKPSYYTALRKGLREHDPRIQAAAHARKSMDTDEYLSIIDEIVAEGHFSEKDVVAAIRSEYNQLKDADSVKLLFEAMASGDKKTAENLKSNFVNDDGEFSKSSYRSAIRKGLRENDPRILQAAEAKLSKDFTAVNKILSQIAEEGRFHRSDISAAITDEYNDLKDD